MPLPVPPHVAEGVKESRALFDLVKEQGRDGALGIVQGERALSRLEHAHGEEREPTGGVVTEADPARRRAAETDAAE